MEKQKYFFQSGAARFLFYGSSHTHDFPLCKANNAAGHGSGTS